MKRISSYLYALLLSITIILSIVSLTMLSKNFILKVIKDINYYQYVEEKTNIEEKKIKEDINKYINNKFKYINYNNNDYNKYINFYKDIKLYQIYLIYIINIIFIIITGIIFNKTKNKHDLNSILIITFFLLTVTYGIIKIYFNSSYLLNKLVNYSNHLLLFIDVLLLMIVLRKKIKDIFNLN